MKGVLLLIVCITSATFVLAQKVDSWNEFAKTKFEPKYNEKLGEYLFHPNFSSDLKAMEGKEITVQGYYVPFAPEDGEYNQIISQIL